LQPAARANLTNLAEVLNKYPDTDVLVEGHTDITGTLDHNMDLSLRRAQMVANHMTGLNVMASRFRMMGYGPDQPVATNDTNAGRQANRRVDIAIFANDKLKSAAQKQTGG
jgi:outer membrane protein OmpA-like peptidoglycan-associated protein